jgi:hypothetical protein
MGLTNRTETGLISRFKQEQRMHNRYKTAFGYGLIFTLLVCFVPAASLAAPGGARLEGLLLDVDGRAADGYSVLLIDDHGQEADRSVASNEGLYSFDGLSQGSYSLAVEDLDGLKAPVVAPPVQLGSQQLARRDLKMVNSDPLATGQALKANYNLNTWWAGLSSTGKASAMVLLAVTVYGVFEALDSQDSASEF